MVAPVHLRGEGHEDGFRSATGLEAEEGTAVVDEVEFDVASAPVELEFLVPGLVGVVGSAAEDGVVGGGVGVAYVAEEGEGLGEAAFGVVVEEDAADSSGFVAVLEVKVVVALLFEARIEVFAVGGAGVAGGLVPGYGVFLEAVVGGEVEASAEPPDGGASFGAGDEEAYVCVRPDEPPFVEARGSISTRFPCGKQSTHRGNRAPG